MTYVIGKECIDVQDQSCVDVCPVDCIYEGERKNYINPVECINCGECEVVCPELAILPLRRTLGNAEREQLASDNAAFFTEVLPGRSVPLGNPGGAAKVGPLGADTALVSGWEG